MKRAFVPVHLGIVVAVLVLSASPALAGSSQYPPRAATCASAPSAGPAGTSVSLKGTNWQPGTVVSVSFVQSGSTALGTATVDSKGKFDTAGTIPSSAQRGKAQIVVTGTGINGQTVSCSTNFEVVDPHHAAAILPLSGTPVSFGAILAGLGVLIGMTAIVSGRRGSSRASRRAKTPVSG